MNFQLNIDTGNDAMNTHADLAEALRAVADKLESGVDAARIRDANGNTVGRWEWER